MIPRVGAVAVDLAEARRQRDKRQADIATFLWLDGLGLTNCDTWPVHLQQDGPAPRGRWSTCATG